MIIQTLVTFTTSFISSDTSTETLSGVVKLDDIPSVPSWDNVVVRNFQQQKNWECPKFAHAHRENVNRNEKNKVKEKYKM